MREINITNDKKRDAQVCMDVPQKTAALKRVNEDGGELFSVKILKYNLALAFKSLAERYGGLLQLGRAIIASDPEVDMEITGRKLNSTRKLYIRPNHEFAYRVDMKQIIRDPQGNEKERRDLTKAMSNITGDDIVHWTGKKFPKDETVRKFVFTKKYQIRHVSGLTYDFLYGMARELHESNSLMFMGGGKKGGDPLILVNGGEPYRGFLEGRINGNKYMLILHLTNMEMKCA